MKKVFLLALTILIVACSDDDNGSVESCECTKLYFSDVGIVIDSVPVTSDTCESVGEYPNDIQHEGGTNFIINCYEWKGRDNSE